MQIGHVWRIRSIGRQAFVGGLLPCRSVTTCGIGYGPMLATTSALLVFFLK